jgi:CHAD domain-containing protein
MDTNLERELKLGVPRAFSLARLEARLDGFVTTPTRWRRLHTIYYDTDDLRLTRWGLSLRFRGGQGWTLKLPVPHASLGLAREEHVFPGERDAVPPAVLDLARAYLRGTAPHPVAELRTLRATRHVYNGEGEDLAELAEDDVRVVEGSRVVQRFRELEIELEAPADDALLDELSAALRGAGAGSPDPTPKNVRVLGPRASEPEIVVPALDANSSAGEAARAALARAAERFVRYDTLLRLHADAEAVHQARVAIRRMRSDLRTFGAVLDRAWADGLREQLRWIGDTLSAARDADVVIARLSDDGTTLPQTDRRRIDVILGPLREEREQAYRNVGAMLREPRYDDLLEAIVEAARAPVLGARAEMPATDAARLILGPAWKSLRKAVRRRSRPPTDRELHRIRIKAKRERYAAEALAPAVGANAHALARAVEALQTVLGTQHDAATASAVVRRIGKSADASFVAGELLIIECQADAQAREGWRASWRKAKRRAQPFK